jgi:hypothetical protein
MTFYHGTVSELAVDPAGGTTYTDISEYLEDIEDDINVHFIDVTTFGNLAKVGIPGLEDGKFKLKGFWDATLDSTFASCKQVVFTFRYRPVGTGAGLPEYTGEAILSSYTFDVVVKDAVSFKAEMTISGGTTRTVQA